MSEPVQVDSPRNERFRQLEALCDSSRERRKRQRSVIEGIKLIRAAIAHGMTFHEWFVTEEILNAPAVRSLANNHASTLIVLTPALFKRASQMANSPGPIAIIDTPRPALPSVFSNDLIYLDRVQDPGNLGTILRTCAAAGITQVVTCPGTAFSWAPKVLRAAMGAHFALQIYEGVDYDALLGRVDKHTTLRALVAPDPDLKVIDLHAADLTGPSAWLCGSEGEGLSDALILAAHQRIGIDQQSAMESLNVAAAIAIALFEGRRQRRVTGAS